MGQAMGAAHCGAELSSQKERSTVLAERVGMQHIALVGMPNSVLLREFQTVASGEHVEFVALEVSIAKQA